MDNKIKYSKIIAGTMGWGSWGKRFSKAQIITMIDHCLEAGITSFDHADIYGGYTTESDFGQAFYSSKINRESIQLITKCGIQLDSDARKNRVKHYDYSKDYIIWSAEQSLKNLRTDYIDLLLLHRPSPLMHPFEIGEAIIKLKKEGKIKDFGVSNFSPSQVSMIEIKMPIFGHQFEFSLTSAEPMYDGTLEDCITHNRMAMSWSPMGTFFKNKDSRRQRIKKVLTPMSKKYDISEDQLLLCWILKHPAAVHPVVGTTNTSRLKAAVEASATAIEREDWFILLEASKGVAVP